MIIGLRWHDDYCSHKNNYITRSNYGSHVINGNSKLTGMLSTETGKP
jgi:hypothetical protein